MWKNLSRFCCSCQLNLISDLIKAILYVLPIKGGNSTSLTNICSLLVSLFGICLCAGSIICTEAYSYKVEFLKSRSFLVRILWSEAIWLSEWAIYHQVGGMMLSFCCVILLKTKLTVETLLNFLIIEQNTAFGLTFCWIVKSGLKYSCT